MRVGKGQFVGSRVGEKAGDCKKKKWHCGRLVGEREGRKRWSDTRSRKDKRGRKDIGLSDGVRGEEDLGRVM